ncbi:hypothetical protein BH09SUM1_BH09SUM1_30060 [soil metagenome]
MSYQGEASALSCEICGHGFFFSPIWKSALPVHADLEIGVPVSIRLDVLAIADMFSAMSRIAADSSVFYAIADPTRRAILDLLKADAACTVMAMLTRLERRFKGLSQSAFSQHLAVLRRAKLVTVRKQGRMRVYSLRAKPLAEIADWVTEYDRFWTDHLGRLGKYLDAQDARPKSRSRKP